MKITRRAKPWIEKLARAGLIAKGLVYVVLGLLAFMAAFNMGKQQSGNADRTDIFVK